MGRTWFEENRVLKSIFVHKREEVAGCWMRLVHILYASPNITRVIKSKRMRWAGHVECMGQKEIHTVYLLEDLDTGGSIILKCRLEGCRLDASGSG
jgi:hypothetical protein